MIKRLFSSQLRVNMVSGVAVTIFNSVILAVMYPLYLHYLGYEQYGIWLVLSTVVSFAQLGNLGINQAIMKLVAEEYGRNDLDAVQQYVSSAVALLLVSGIVVLVLIRVLREPIIALFKLSDENARTVSWLLPYIACLSMYIFIVQAVNAVLAGMGRMDLSNYIQTAGRAMGLLMTGVLLYQGRGISSLLLGSTFSYVFTHIGSLVVIHRIMPLPLLQVRNIGLERIRRLLSFGTAVLGTSLVSMLLTPFNKLMLARYAGVASVPVYDIAYFGSMQVRGLIEAGFRALTPEISRLTGDMNARVKERIRRVYRTAINAVFALGIPVYGSLLMFLDTLLRLWLQDRMTAGLTWTFRVMLVGSFLSLMCVPAYYTLLGLGRADQCFIGQVLQAGINATIVVGIVAVSAELSVLHVVLASLPAIGATTVYLTIQNRRALQ